MLNCLLRARHADILLMFLLEVGQSYWTVINMHLQILEHPKLFHTCPTRSGRTICFNSDKSSLTVCLAQQLMGRLDFYRWFRTWSGKHSCLKRHSFLADRLQQYEPTSQYYSVNVRLNTTDTNYFSKKRCNTYFLRCHWGSQLRVGLWDFS